MQWVETVTGPAEPAELGFTLIHEHLSVSSAGIWQAWPELFGGRGAVVARATEHLQQLKAEGIETYVDATTIDLGRNIELIRDVAAASGMRIIASTGYWLDVSFTMQNRSVEELTDFFTREIQDGIDGTRIKAGVIKVATQESITDFGERVLRAASRTLRATGVPIITHSGAKFKNGADQADVFEDEGANPRRIAIGHSDDTDDLSYLTSLLKRGFWLAMDRLPYGALDENAPPDVSGRVDIVTTLLESGYERQLMLSHDECIHDGMSTPEGEKRRRAANPEQALFLKRKFLPMLRANGVTEDTINTLMVSNPRRFFEA